HFDNFGEENVSGTVDWATYKIKAKLHPKKTSGISIALFLSGEGKIWADQLHIKVDGKELNREMFIPYMEDYSLITRSEVVDFEGTSEIYSRRGDLAKIWGLLKYKHPAVAKGNFNWDAELYKSINRIISIEDNIELE